MIRRLAVLGVVVLLAVAGCTTHHRRPVAGPSPGAGTVQTGAAPGYASPSSASTPPVSASPSPSASGGRWRPTKGLTWQWQLTGTIDTSLPVNVYDVDAFETSAATVAALHAKGRKVICYVNVGAKEDFRPDAALFPAAVVGKGLDGWAGEHWLDIRQWSVLRPLLATRFQMCHGKGFDGLEPDNIDGYSNGSGFPLTAADQLTYNRNVAALAHSYGLAVGLKNDVDQAEDLEPQFDFAIDEQCVQYSECDSLSGFIAADKPVFHVEYSGSTSFCPTTKALGFSSMLKKQSLDAWRESC